MVTMEGYVRTYFVSAHFGPQQRRNHGFYSSFRTEEGGAAAVLFPIHRPTVTDSLAPAQLTTRDYGRRECPGAFGEQALIFLCIIISPFLFSPSSLSLRAWPIWI